MDGLRVDAVHALVDGSATHILEQVAREVEDLEAILQRHLVVVAESDLNDPRVVRSRDAGGYGCHAQWSDDFHHALHTVLTGERSGYYGDFGTLSQLGDALRHGFVYRGQYSQHRRRVHGRPATGVPGWRFVVAAQTHDQVGNRARGERLAHLTSPGRLKIAAALLLCGPFVPLLFQGEEWGASTPFLFFTGHEDPELARAVRDGRRRELAALGWDPETVPDPQARGTFERSLRWSERSHGACRDLLDWYRRLIALRRDTPALRRGRQDDLHAVCDERAGTLIVRRNEIAVACNLSGTTATIDVQGIRGLLLKSTDEIRREGDALSLPQDSVAVLSLA